MMNPNSTFDEIFAKESVSGSLRRGDTSALALVALLALSGITEHAQALTDPGILPNVPGKHPVPPGYGNYCSVVDPTNGGWALSALPSGDSCAALEPTVGPDTIVHRAGLWAVSSNNNVMVRCEDGTIYYGRRYGASAVSWIYDKVTTTIFGRVVPTHKNCVFTIAPTRLPVFGAPFYTGDTYDLRRIDQRTHEPLLIGKKADITYTPAVFDYHLGGYGPVWDIKDFGRSGGDGKATQVDRTGYEYKNSDNKTPPQPGPSPYPAAEPAYDWNVVKDTPLLAVADGVIVESYARRVWPLCWKDADRATPPFSDQLELFLETQVGTGQYAEHFVAAYHHMNPNPDTSDPLIAENVKRWGGPMAPKNARVKRGDVIGYAGASGCATDFHLDLSTFRLTNLTDARSYVFEPLLTTYDTAANATSGVAGVNGWQGIFDPFGWAAPRGVDPLAYKFIGVPGIYDQPNEIKDIGTFSINIWVPDAFEFLPKNGGASY